MRFCITLWFQMCCIYAWSQQSKPILVKVNFLSPIVGAMTVHTEFGITQTASLNLYTTLAFANSMGNGAEGWLVGAEYRFYGKTKGRQRGVYIAPFLSYRDFVVWGNFSRTDDLGRTIDDNELGIPLHNFNGGLVVGKQWIVASSNFVIDAFGGPMVSSWDLTPQPENLIGTGATISKYSQITLRLGATIGYRF